MILNWFEELKRIWEEKDISAVKSLLADEFSYYEDPLRPPLTRWPQVEVAWQEIKNQEISVLDIKILIDKGNEGFATYTFIYRDANGIGWRSLGAYYVQLDGEGKAKEFRQWWASEKISI